jgi:YD repeat-containing protein
MERLRLVFLCFILFSGSFCADVWAQAPPQSCLHGVSEVYNINVPGLFNCQPPPLFEFIGYTCWFLTCPPPDCVKECRCPPGGCGGKGGNQGGKPIHFSDGNTFIEQNDVSLPGLSNGLRLTRTWNSTWPDTQMVSQVGSFGPNWRSTYEERIFGGSDNYIKYARSDGSFWSFGGGLGTVLGPANGGASLSLDNGLTQWTVTFQNGERRTFNYNSGSLTAIIDRNGNTTQLTYDGLNRLVTVTDPVGRHLTFTYANNTSFLVTGVSSDVGNLSLTYTYDTQNRLIQVTKPDLTTLNFQYDSNSMITSVTDSNGKVLESHTYDSNHRGLTSARANGVEALTVTYP